MGASIVAERRSAAKRTALIREEAMTTTLDQQRDLITARAGRRDIGAFRADSDRTVYVPAIDATAVSIAALGAVAAVAIATAVAVRPRRAAEYRKRARSGRAVRHSPISRTGSKSFPSSALTRALRAPTPRRPASRPIFRHAP